MGAERGFRNFKGRILFLQKPWEKPYFIAACLHITSKQDYRVRKIIAAINMTIDGFCDHTVMVADEELHRHYSQLLRNAGTLVYGRKTYRLMEDYWPSLVKKPSGVASMDEFAQAIDTIPKIVFSRTLDHVEWETARLSRKTLEEELSSLRLEKGRDIVIGSPGLIASLTKLRLIDEYQLCMHPVLAGAGLPLFKDTGDRMVLSLFKTRPFRSGALLLYYTRDHGNS